MDGNRAPNRRMTSMFGNAQYSDFTIRCGDREWPVHRAIVFPQAPLWTTLVQGRQGDEANSLTIRTTNLPNVVHIALKWLYDKEYDDNMFAHDANYHPLLINIHVVQFADRSFFPELKALAEAKFKSRIETDWRNAPATFALAIRAVFGETPVPDAFEKLRTDIIATCVEHAEDLCATDEEDEDHYAEFYECLYELGVFAADFATDLVGAQPARPPSGPQLRAGEARARCGCGQCFVWPGNLNRVFCPSCGYQGGWHDYQADDE